MNGRRNVRIIERRFSDKWKYKVACMKGSERIGRRQRRMGDLWWKINIVVQEFKKKD